jgi:hypothetical protein
LVGAQIGPSDRITASSDLTRVAAAVCVLAVAVVASLAGFDLCVTTRRFGLSDNDLVSARQAEHDSKG